MAAGSARLWARVDPLALGAAVAIALAWSIRTRLGLRAPLWFDETFTAVIASTPTFAAWLDWVLHEVGGPVYYLVAWMFEKVAGDGNVALRLPGVAAWAAAPLVAWRWGPGDATARRVWAALLALWLPGIALAADARCYPLLYLLATAQTVAFVHAVAAPATRTAFVWAALSALAVLTHYHALAIAGLQGLLYLALGGRAAWRSGRAALAFVPMFAWMAIHLGFVFTLLKPGNAWFSPLTGRDVAGLLVDLWGGPLPAAAAWTALAAGATWAVSRRAARPFGPGEQAVVAAALVALAVILGAGMLRPSFTFRYVVPVVPALLLGVALVAARAAAQLRPLPLVTVGVFALTAIAATRGIDAAPAAPLNLEQPSDWIALSRPRRLLFLWDNPTGDASPPASLAPVAGWFLHRRGLATEVVVARLLPDADPNTALAQARRPGDAVLWLYDTAVPRTRGRRYPFTPSRLGSRCRDMGTGAIHVIACRAGP